MNIPKVVEKIVADRIKMLATIITNTPADKPAHPAIIQLAMIGTREAADTLMRLTEECSNPTRQTYMAAALIFHSPFREEYFTTLTMICNDPLKLVALQGSLLLCDQRLCGPPLWQELVEATQQAMLNGQPDIFDPAVGD